MVYNCNENNAVGLLIFFRGSKMIVTYLIKLNVT